MAEQKKNTMNKNRERNEVWNKNDGNKVSEIKS